MSRTVTSRFPFASFPAASLAVQATVVVPSGNVAPDAGAHCSCGAGSRTSVAASVTVAPAGEVASTTVLPGSTGGVRSIVQSKLLGLLSSDPATART